MILLNVLLIVALAASVLALMLVGEDASIQRSTRMHEAAQAAAIACGGELSAVVALRRDAVVAPQADTLREPWANIGDRAARIEGGRFDLAVGDAQAKFNVNALTRGDLASRDTFARIVMVLGLDPEVTQRIAAFLFVAGPAADIAQLAQAGVDDADLVRLATLVTALPGQTSVNVNTAPEALLAVMLGNPAIAHRLSAQRERAGALTGADFVSAQAILPPGAGTTSNYFWSRARATIGDTSQHLTSLLVRRSRDGHPEVAVIARWPGSIAPLQAPPLSP